MRQRVLVVEDAIAYRDRLSKSLRDEGFEVEVAANGLEAIKAIERHRPDAVVCDTVMPRMSGFSVLEDVRRVDRRLPFILTSPSSDTSVREHAKEVGASAFISRNAEMASIVGTVRGCLKRGRAGLIPALPSEGPVLRQGRMTFGNESLLAVRDFHQGAAELLNPLVEKDRVHVAQGVAAVVRVMICCGNLQFPPKLMLDPAFDNRMRRRAIAPPYRDRRVVMLGMLQRQRLRICFQDQGPGFDYRELPKSSFDLPYAFFAEVNFRNNGEEIELIFIPKSPLLGNSSSM